MQAAMLQAKELNKAAYFFSTTDEGKVVHLNFVPKTDITKSFSAKTWIQPISAILGGKVRATPSSLHFAIP